MNKSLFFLLLVLHVFFSATSMARPTPRKLVSSIGPWLPIQNVSNPAVQAMGAYAVSEYDKTTTYHLEFIEVVNGSTFLTYFTYHTQVKWLLWVEAKNCTKPDQSGIYQTLVYEDTDTPVFGDGPSNYTRSFGYLEKLGGTHVKSARAMGSKIIAVAYFRSKHRKENYVIKLSLMIHTEVQDLPLHISLGTQEEELEEHPVPMLGFGPDYEDISCD